ncbi:MAG TPA: thiolase domain-containing protein [Anaerolineales bacterium]|nr:thiolase domain-containing protein [Anaerolineales bacterium]
MRQVGILGIGQTKIDEHWDRSLRDLGVDAIRAAMEDGGRITCDGLFVGNMLSGISNHQDLLGSLLSDWSDMQPVEAVKVEAACASGGAAFRSALMAVASGELDSAMVVGVEKMTDSGSAQITAALATAADADNEVDQGVSFVGLNALIMQRYMHEYGWKHTDFAPFSINSHANAVHNPCARLRNRITLEQYQKAVMVSAPINILDASPIGDGAAAILLVPIEDLPDRSKIIVCGSASFTDSLAIHDRSDAITLRAAYRSAKSAYQQAKVQANNIDVFELHDAFSIMAALSLEACGFAEQGQGPRLALDGEIEPDGRIPICTRGGLKARGHPVGATGVYQLVELVQQLRGECGATQVEDAMTGMAQNIGGSGSTIVTHILKKTVI